jgi:hypothetical protein
MIRVVRALRGIVGWVTPMVAVVALLSGCGVTRASADPDGSQSNHPNSGLSGRVLIGPACPVAGAGQTCFQPYKATIAIRAAVTGRLVATVRSSANGRFRFALVPGKYRLIPQTARPYPRASAQTATVHSHRYTSVVIYYNERLHPAPM